MHDSIKTFKVGRGGSFLKYFRLALERPSPKSIEDRALLCPSLFGMIEPLTQAHCIETFYVSFHVSAWLTDSDMTSLAASWPNLKDIRIEPVGNTCPTFGALVELASRCPLLQYASLRLSFDSLPRLEKVPSMKHGLEGLEFSVADTGVDDSPEHSKQIAIMLRRLFPVLELVEGENKPPEAASRRRAEVMRYLGALQRKGHTI